MVFTGTGSLDSAFYFLSRFVFGSPEATGLFILTILFIGAMMVRIDFVVALVLLIPVNVVLVANGNINLMVSGLHVLVVFIVLAVSFFRPKT